MPGRSRFLSATIALMLLTGVAASDEPKKDVKGPLALLPSKPGPHIEKIRALGDNSWLELESPAPDPTHGPSHGRSWSSRMAYAPDLGGAFIFGEGTHGGLYKDNHYADDLFFHDANANAWICLYPGFDVTRYDQVTISADGFECVDGAPTPIASMVHGYAMTAYDSDLRRFVSMPCPGNYWGKIKGRKDVVGDVWSKLYRSKLNDHQASPWMYDVGEGRWRRFKTKHTTAIEESGGSALVYLPSMKKVWHSCRRSMHYYDPATNDWTTIEPKGPKPPFGIEMNVCLDTRRDRIYLGGGGYPEAKKGDNALWVFDLKTETYIDPRPQGAPCEGESYYGTNAAMMNYDSVNDVVVLIKTNGPGSGVYVYDPATNAWSTQRKDQDIPFWVREQKEQFKPHGMRSGYYDEKRNVHFVFGAADTYYPEIRPTWDAFAYRYKRGVEPGK